MELRYQYAKKSCLDLVSQINGTDQDLDKKESLKNPETEEHFFVIESLAGKPVGCISANNINKMDGSFRYGIAIIATERNKGYASEAIKILLNYYFNELRYHKVNAGVYAFNQASIALHQNLKMVEEGRLRETKYTNGKYWDHLIFGLTKKEFNTIHL